MEFKEDELTFTVGNIKEIELKITAIGTEHSVAYDFGTDLGKLAEDQSLQLSEIENKSSGAVNLGYSTLKNGKYKIEVDGNTGKIGEFMVYQTPGRQRDIFSFSLDGDRVKIKYPPKPPVKKTSSEAALDEGIVVAGKDIIDAPLTFTDSDIDAEKLKY